MMILKTKDKNQQYMACIMNERDLTIFSKENEQKVAIKLAIEDYLLCYLLTLDLIPSG